TRAQSRCCVDRPHPAALLGRLIVGLRSRSVHFDALDAAVARRVGLVHLALADDLVVGRLENKEGLLVCRDLALILGVVRSVLLPAGDAVQRALPCLVHLAREDRLAVAGLEVEIELAVGRLLDHERAHVWMLLKEWGDMGGAPASTPMLRPAV